MKIRLLVFHVAVVLLIAAFLASCAGTGKTAGRVVDDSVITTKVKALLIDDDITKAFAIEVKTFQGVVQLSGFVNTPATVEKAGRIAGSVDGVREVKNNLIVK